MLQRRYSAHDIAKDFVDRDGWLTDAVAAGGKKRLTFDVARHAFRVAPKNGDNPRTSADVYAEIMEDPSNVAVVVSDAPEIEKEYDRHSEPWACAVASVCDAAGLIDKGKRIVCLTLEDYKGADSIDGRWSYGWSRGKHDLYGSTAAKHDEIARELLAAGAELVAAPAGWDGDEPKTRIVKWVRKNVADYATFTSPLNYAASHGNTRFVPAIDAETDVLRKVAGAFGGDEAKQSRKRSLAVVRELFKGLELSPEETVELLSYGHIAWEDAKSKSYKVPVWKKDLLFPTVERLPEFSGGHGADDVAQKMDSCVRIWRASLNAYGVSFKPGSADSTMIVRIWKELGASMGVDSSIEAVLEHDVPADDIIADLRH